MPSPVGRRILVVDADEDTATLCHLVQADRTAAGARQAHRTVPSPTGKPAA